jgi:gliding motility-associated-like protein
MNFRSARFFLIILLFISGSTKSFAQLVADFTVDDADGCAPLLASFTDASFGTPTSYSWDFGDGFTSTDPNPFHNYTFPGTYTVTLTVTNASTSDTEVKTNFITVFRNPTAKYLVTVDTICSGTSVTFTDSSTVGDGAINHYEWDFQDGTSSVIGPSVVNHVFNNNSNTLIAYVPILLINDVNGCNSLYSSNSIYVQPFTTASFGLGANSSCTLPANIVFTNTSTGPPLYTWDFGDPGSGANNTSTQATPSHTYNAAGSYLVTLTNGAPGCEVTDTMTVDINPPTAAFTVNDTIICRGDTAFFTNTSTPSNASFQWTFGDGSVSSFQTSPSHRYVISGTFTVKLKVTLGACTDSVTRTIFVPPPPSLTFTSPDVTSCSVPFAVTFNANPTPQNVAWQWNFGDPSSGAADTSSLQNPVHTYNSFGNYNIKLNVTDVYGCRDSIQLNNYVQIIQPQIDFTREDSGCVGDNFTFNATVNSPADPTITDYTWDFGDGSPTQSGPGPGATHQYNAPGLYDVTLTVTTQSGCTATLVKQDYIRIGTKPDAQIDSVLHTICFKDNVSFTDLTAPPVTGWLWFFGDGGSSTQQNPNHQYNIDTSGVANPFDIILIAYYNGCPDTDTVAMMVTVLSPLPNFDPVYNCTNPYSVDFTNLTGGADSYSWDFGDGSPADINANPTHIFPSRGSYSVKLTASNSSNGCVIDTTLEVQITDLITTLETDTNRVCHPGVINFTGSNSQDANSYTWYFGEGIAGVRDTSFAADTLHLYNRTGFYTVTLITTDIHGCTESDTQQVHVIGPESGFTANPFTGCSPINVNFTDTSHTEGGAITQWVWNYGTGIPAETTLVGTAAHSYTLPGQYSVTLTVTDVNGCTDTHTSVNYINPTAPDADILLPDTLGCRNTPELITGYAGAPGTYSNPVTYQWDFGDSQTSSDTARQVNHTYANNGTYTIQLTVTDANGCTDATTRNIFVYTTSAHFNVATTELCVDSNGIKKAFIRGVFTGDSNFYVNNANWNWDFTVFNQPSWQSNVIQYNFNVAPGTYDATLILTNDFGCMDTFVSPGAIVVPGPTGSFSFQPDSGCSPLTVDFTGVSTNSSIYAWDFGDGSVLNGTSDLNVSHTYTTPNSYTPQFYLGFQLTNSFCYIPVQSAGNVTVTSALGVDILEDVIYVTPGDRDTLTVLVNNGVPPYSYNWTPAGQVINGPTSNTFLATSEQDSVYYYVSVPYGTQGCAGIDRVLIRLLPENCELRWDSIPNVFTPNGDFKNDFFEIRNLCRYDGFLIKIYNRWGRLLYESTNIDFKWDGTTTGGDEVSDGVYYYIMKAKTREIHGYIQLIRNER